jgi:peptidoglycan/xylan/chitin deacetylase (PgdA/CDA1 family)
MPCILWSVDTLDWKTRDSESVYNEIINNVKDGDIVLMHSLYKSTAEAVEKVLPELYKEGYQIVSVSKLFELKDKTLEIGKSYTSAR